MTSTPETTLDPVALVLGASCLVVAVLFILTFLVLLPREERAYWIGQILSGAWIFLLLGNC